MWKLFALLALVASAIGDDQGPRKLFRYQGDELFSSISTFADPLNGIEYRLPNDTKPVLYEIKLTTAIHEGDFSFTGHVEITIVTVNPTNVITLHQRQLTITEIVIWDEDMNDTFLVVGWSTAREDQEFLDINLSEDLVQNKMYTIVIDYTGTLRDDDAGFYRSSYLNEAGKEIWLATTQFESTDARHAFPCYDEPGIRSEFAITIRHHSSYNAISNMPVESPELPPGTEAGYVDTKFLTTKFMQTYLIAFTISDFTSTDDLSDPVRPHKVYANPQYIAAGFGDLAVSASRKLLDGFADYLGVPYTLTKMDQAAIPDFAAGAMENWGLVTYAEPYLLFDPAESTTRDRENVIATIAHEYAHQWFGDLVSPAWWSYLWMNEGFATLYENHLTDLVYPDERWLDTFLIDTVQPVMEVDANPNIRPMTYYVEDPEKIDNLFDNVAYPKSGSVLKMFQNAFGDDTWKSGLKLYLTEKSSSLEFSVATPDDLHAGIQAAVNLTPNPKGNVDEAMKSWENQSGFPYINVTKSGNVVTFHQNRFMYSDRTSPNIYHVPINYAVASNLNFTDTKADFWLDTRSTTLEGGLTHKPINADDWIIVNLQQSGFYRVNYDANLWSSIVQHLNSNQFEQIHLFNRAQLIDDSHHLARANLLEYDTLLRVMNYLEKEDDYIPWVSASRANTLLNRWLTGTRVYPAYREFMQKNVAKLFARYGVVNKEDDQRVDRYARLIAINIACHFQNPSCLTLTEQRVAGVVLSSEKVENELVSTVYCNGLRTANATVFLAVQHKMLQSTRQSERNSLINALGCSQNEQLLHNYLQLAVIPGIALSETEKSRILLSPLNYGEASLLTMIKFVKANSLALPSSTIISLCNSIASRVSSLTAYNEFSSLVSSLRLESLITDAQVFDLREAALTITRWQEDHLESIAAVFGIAPLDTSTPFNPPNTSPTTPASTTAGAGNIFASTIVMISSILIKLLL